MNKVNKMLQLIPYNLESKAIAPDVFHTCTPNILPQSPFTPKIHYIYSLTLNTLHLHPKKYLTPSTKYSLNIICIDLTSPSFTFTHLISSPFYIPTHIHKIEWQEVHIAPSYFV